MTDDKKLIRDEIFITLYHYSAKAFNVLKEKQINGGKFRNLRNADLLDVCNKSADTIIEKWDKGEIVGFENKIMILKDGKLEPLEHHLTTYYTAMCIQEARNRSERTTRQNDIIAGVHIPYAKRKELEKSLKELGGSTQDFNKNARDISTIIANDSPDDYMEDVKTIIRLIVKNLPKPCEEILWGRYDEGLSYEDIALKLPKYNSAASVKVQKSRCIDKLYKKKEEIIDLIPEITDKKARKITLRTR